MHTARVARAHFNRQARIILAFALPTLANTTLILHIRIDISCYMLSLASHVFFHCLIFLFLGQTLLGGFP